MTPFNLAQVSELLLNIPHTTAWSDRQLKQGKFGSGIAQGHTPILGLPPSPGSDTPFPQSQNDFCVALPLHQNTR
jgi:hypothetical protein